MNRITPEQITAATLTENQIFVFGSNESGIHGGGAARFAHQQLGAVWGQPEGHFVHTYAIPTKSKGITRTLELSEIKPYVDRFIAYAKGRPDLTFLVTEVGCGLAGLTPEEVAPLFWHAHQVKNIWLPRKFWINIQPSFGYWVGPVRITSQDINFLKEFVFDLNRLAKNCGEDLPKKLSDFSFSVESDYQAYYGLDTDNWDRVHPREHVANSDLTCFNCEVKGDCQFVWDQYNTNGDCLADK